jgi:hypothetical protein
MEIQKQEIKQLCSKFMLTGVGARLETLVNNAEKQNMGLHAVYTGTAPKLSRSPPKQRPGKTN